MSIYQSIEDLTGHTPLVELSRLVPDFHGHLLGKLELMNPTGSAKDRVALSILRDAERRGLLGPGATVIEATSGNTGISLAMFCSRRSIRCIIVMPDTMTPERIALLRAYGAEVLLTPGPEGMAGAVEAARELSRRTPRSFIPEQFANPANPDAHFHSTGPEIWADAQGQVDMLVAGVGTGGTISGAGRFLRTKKPAIQIVAVEPAESPLLSHGRSGSHGIQGIGPNFLPDTLDLTLPDQIITVSSDQAMAAARTLARQEGILAGISAGAAIHAAIDLARREENRGKTIVAILPDSGHRYLSLFQS